MSFRKGNSTVRLTTAKIARWHALEVDGVFDHWGCRPMPVRWISGRRWSADRRTLLAYVYNCTGHECLEGRRDLSGAWHRTPLPTACEISLRNLPAGLTCRRYSLDAKRCLRDVHLDGATTLRCDRATDDYLLVVIPAPAIEARTRAQIR